MTSNTAGFVIQPILAVAQEMLLGQLIFRAKFNCAD